jgi:acyl-CoA reductase-like NAD-dependent aldehyde dehydrogenase
MESATEAFKTFRLMPAPQRGEIVRQFGETLRKQRGFRKIGFLKWEIFTRRIWRSSGND